MMDHDIEQFLANLGTANGQRCRRKQSTGADLAGRLASARHRLGLSQNELSRRAKLSLNNINRIEMGENRQPTFYTLERLALTLGVRWEWLATGKGEP